MSPGTTLLLSPIPTGWQTLLHAVLSDGTLAVVATDIDPSDEWVLTHNGRARLLMWQAGGWQDGPLFAIESATLIIDRFTDGRWLVVGSRTRGEPNACVFASDGTPLSRFMLGDAIAHVVIDDADRIWVGWFDEGIPGRPWGVPGMKCQPSVNGVACFASDGSVAEVPPWPGEAGLIVDCYALTPAGAAIWASPYTDFPLVRFVPGKPAKWWRNDLAGPTAIAVDGNHALIAGGYHDDSTRLALIRLEGTGSGDAATPLATWELPLRRADSVEGWSEVWERPSILAGRGDTVHLVDDGKWFRWRVRDAVTALGHA